MSEKRRLPPVRFTFLERTGSSGGEAEGPLFTCSDETADIISLLSPDYVRCFDPFLDGSVC